MAYYLEFSTIPTQGDFTLSDGTTTTGPIAWNASSSAIGSATSVLSGGPYSVTGSWPLFRIDTFVPLTLNATPLSSPSPQYDWSFATDGTDSVGGNTAVLGSLTASGGLQCDGTNYAYAADTGLSDGTLPFELSCTYTPSSDDVAGTNPLGTDSYFVGWGSSPGTNSFMLGIASGQWLAYCGAGTNFFGSPTAGVASNLDVTFDGSLLTAVVDSVSYGPFSVSMSVILTGNSLTFGADPGASRAGSGLLSDVEFYTITPVPLEYADTSITPARVQAGLANGGTFTTDTMQMIYTADAGSNPSYVRFNETPSGSIASEGELVTIYINGTAISTWQTGSGGNVSGCVDDISGAGGVTAINMLDYYGTDYTSTLNTLSPSDIVILAGPGSDYSPGTPGRHEIQSITLPSGLNAGTWDLTSLGGSGPYTGLAWDIPAATLQGLIQGNMTFPSATVSLTGTTYTIDFGQDGAQSPTTPGVSGSGLLGPVTGQLIRIAQNPSFFGFVGS